MSHRNAKKLILLYTIVGVTCIILGGQIQKLTGYNVVFSGGRTLEYIVSFAGFITLLVGVSMGGFLLFSSNNPTSNFIESFEKHELKLQILKFVSSMLLLVSASVIAINPVDYQLVFAFKIIGFAALTILGGVAARSIRTKFLSEHVPSLHDERHVVGDTKSMVNGYYWILYSALLGLVAHLTFDVHFPVWFALLAPTLIGYLGVNWYLLCELLREKNVHNTT